MTGEFCCLSVILCFGFLSFTAFFTRCGGKLNFEGTASFFRYLLSSVFEWGREEGYK